MTTVLLLALTAVVLSLPEMHYRLTSFATTAPLEAAKFCERYFGGEIVENRELWLTHHGLSADADAVAVRFYYNDRADFHDVYFVNDPSKPSGPMSIAKYTEYLHKLHRFDLQETWDWYQDWHLCFHVDNVDLIVHRLLQDNISFVSRSHYSIYVEIPHGITFQFLGHTMSLAWTENFNFCRFTNGLAKEQPLQIAALGKTPALPELPPSHHSYFSNHPDVAFNWTLKYTSGTAYDMSGVWKESHEYSDGRCALLRWVQFPSYQIHFVDQYRKNQGNFTTLQMEKYLQNLHGDMSRVDAYFDFRVGFEVDDLAPFKTAFDNDNIKYYTSNTSPSSAHSPRVMSNAIIVQIPGGILLELLETKGKLHMALRGGA